MYDSTIKFMTILLSSMHVDDEDRMRNLAGSWQQTAEEDVEKEAHRPGLVASWHYS